jgi:thiol-disulfide isomerase/thioredoxin
MISEGRAMRLLCAGVLVVSVGLYAAFANTKEDPPKDAQTGDQADRLQAVKKKFDEEFDDLRKRFTAATTPAEKKGIQGEARELAVLTAEKVRKVAEEDPKSETALQAAQYALGVLVPRGGSGPDTDKLLAIVAEHHANSPKVKDLVLAAGRAGASAQTFLKGVAEKSTDKEVRGLALYTLGGLYAELADDAEGEKETTELTAKAIANLEQAAKEAPDLKVGNGTLATAAAADIETLKRTAVGQPAPAVTGTDLHGKKVALADYKGKVVLLDIWATWCGPCRGMIPHEREMVKRLEGKPFVLVSVSVDEKKEDLTEFQKKEPMPWVHWWDGENGAVAKTFRVKGFPTLYLIDAKGVIRKKWIGAPDGAALDKAVDEVIK